MHTWKVNSSHSGFKTILCSFSMNQQEPLYTHINVKPFLENAMLNHWLAIDFEHSTQTENLYFFCGPKVTQRRNGFVWKYF